MQLLDGMVSILPNGFIDGVLEAHVRGVDIDSNTLLLELTIPLEGAGERFQYAVASPRLEGDDLATLIQSGRLGFNVTWVPESRFNAKSPFNLSWWRGGAAAIADLVFRSK